MSTKQTIFSIQYYALKVYFETATKRLKRVKNAERIKFIEAALVKIRIAMNELAKQYQLTLGITATGDIIPPPPPPPPPEDWP